MFGVGPLKLVAILVLALIVLRPQKFPEAARGAGEAMTEFRTLPDELKRSVAIELDQLEERHHSAWQSDEPNDVDAPQPGDTGPDQVLVKVN